MNRRLTEKLNIAIFCSSGVGDALVQMIIANNLTRMGAQVKFYSDTAVQFQPLVRDYALMRLPSYPELLDEIENQHVILYDSSAPYIRQLPKQLEKWFIHNAICYRLSHQPPRHQVITREQIAKRLPSDNQHLAEFFKNFNATLRDRLRFVYRPPVVEQLCRFLEDKVGFVSVTTDNGIVRPEKGEKTNKALIHPSSSNVKKNWPSDKYIELATRLNDQGLKPVFTVAPSERDDWLTIVKNRFDVPLFPSLSDLAEYYSDASVFVGNDSGNAHLASYLGVPTVQVFRRYRRYPAWRAGWAKNRVVIARFPYSFSATAWQNGVSVEAVEGAVKTMLEE